MSRNGSGVYTLPAGNPVVTLTQISSTWANNTLSDIATEITNSIDKGGRTVPTANLPMAGYKHTGAGDAMAAGQYLVYGQNTAVLSDNTTDGRTALTAGGMSFGIGQAWVSAASEIWTAKGLNIGTTAAQDIALFTNNVARMTVTSTGVAVTGACAISGNVTAGNIASGTYTPTVANESNITSVAVLAAQYLRVGNVVTVSGQCTITPASAASATFSLSLPIAVTGLVGETHKVAGVMAVPGADLAVRVRGSGLAATQVAWLQDTYPGTSGYVASYHFTYLLE